MTTEESTAKTKDNPIITSITPNDFGLKIGVRYGDKTEQIGFLPILGWASVGNYIEAGTVALTPVVKGPQSHPMLASPATVKGYVGLFPIHATVADIAGVPAEERPT